jgi:UDP-glucose/iron transport system permease protein
MNGAYIDVTVMDLVLASGLLVLNFALSAAFQLGLGRRLFVAAIRMVVQLSLVGLVLEWVFTSANGFTVLGIALAMSVIAGVTAARRTRIRFLAAYLDAVVVIVGTTFLVTGVALIGVLEVDPWWNPQYLIPLLGMLLGNSLTGISLGLDRFLTGVLEDRARVEGYLALGATRWEAAREDIQEAMRVGLIPTVNSMLVMGVVSLPGMMTGQLLAGAAPGGAVRYQVLIMFMIAASVALATFGTTMLAYLRVFTADHRLKRVGESR